MSWLLRIPLILVLWVLVIACAVPALAVTLFQTNHMEELAKISEGLVELAASTSWIEAGLLYVAAALFFIASIRLFRRTQAFWAWLFGFAAYAGRWAWTQQSQEGGVMASIQSLSLDSFSLSHLSEGGTSAQVVVLGIILVVGVLIIVVDVLDRRFWDKNAD